MNSSGSECGLKIGEVARITGLSVKTIRYYEEIGLLTPTVARSRAGYRIFGNGIVSRLDFIKRSQSLGLSLQEIKEILGTHDRGELPCSEVKHHLQDRVAAITEQIEDLQRLRLELHQVLSGWQEQPHPVAQTICPNLQP
jgi:MerR family transcriptional regulator, copper efflux regulator